MSSPSEIPPILMENQAGEASRTQLTNLRNLFYQWNGLGHVHHDGTRWRSVTELQKTMGWSHALTQRLWWELGESHPRWCCSRCPTRGAGDPDQYVTREGALRMLMEEASECDLFWKEVIPSMFNEENPVPQKRLQVYSVVRRTANQGNICPTELYEFKEEMRDLGWVHTLQGPNKVSDYFKTQEFMERAIPMIKGREWASI